MTLCGHCAAPDAQKLCSRCKAAPYCSAACQKQAWAAHKLLCKVPGSLYPTVSKKGDSLAECANCAARGDLKACGGCHLPLYCSTDCQAQHWAAGHKKDCVKPSARRPADQLPEVRPEGPICPVCQTSGDTHEMPCCSAQLHAACIAGVALRQGPCPCCRTALPDLRASKIDFKKLAGDEDDPFFFQLSWSRALARAHKFDAAIQTIEPMLLVTPALGNMVMAKMLSDYNLFPDRAEVCFRSALQSTKLSSANGSDNCYAFAVFLWRQNRDPEALELFRKVAGAHPLGLANFLLDAGSGLDEAEELFHGAVRQNPLNHDAWLGLVRVLELQHRLPLAGALLRGYPSNWVTHSMLARVAVARGEWAAAETEALRAIDAIQDAAARDKLKDALLSLVYKFTNDPFMFFRKQSRVEWNIAAQADIANLDNVLRLLLRLVPAMKNDVFADWTGRHLKSWTAWKVEHTA